ncbi:MAG: hypothetical protein JWM18_2601 [Chloroflexi bacterium]|jgi:hypothetical protein|nr:hypothetical protein [Chloroflexota bacterium]
MLSAHWPNPLAAAVLADIQAEDAHLKRRRPPAPTPTDPSAPRGSVAALLAGVTVAVYLGAPVWTASSIGVLTSIAYMRWRRRR